MTPNPNRDDRRDLLDRHVRADITTLTSVIGLAPATDFSRTIGMLCVASKDRRAQRRGKTEPDVIRFYLVTETLAAHLRRCGALCASYDDLNIWLREGNEPLHDDPALSGFAPIRNL